MNFALAGMKLDPRPLVRFDQLGALVLDVGTNHRLCEHRANIKQPVGVFARRDAELELSHAAEGVGVDLFARGPGDRRGLQPRDDRAGRRACGSR